MNLCQFVLHALRSVAICCSALPVQCRNPGSCVEAERADLCGSTSCPEIQHLVQTKICNKNVSCVPGVLGQMYPSTEGSCMGSFCPTKVCMTTQGYECKEAYDGQPEMQVAEGCPPESRNKRGCAVM